MHRSAPDAARRKPPSTIHLPIDVKTSEPVRPAEARHVQSFRAAYPDHSLPWVLLYTGEETYWVTDEVLVVPWWRVV